MEGLTFNSDFRQRVATSQVSEGIVVSYDVRQKTGLPVESIVGSILKNGNRIGAVSVDKKTSSFYISFEKFDQVELEEREAIMINVNQNIEQLLSIE